MMRNSLLLATLLVACSPGIDERPGDEQAEAWHEPAPACEPAPVSCPGGEIVGDVTLSDDCAELSDCVVRGQLTIGRAPTRANAIDPEWSYSANYVDELRRLQAKGVRVTDVTVEGPPGRVAIYVAPGTTWTWLTRVHVVSRGQGGPAVYLGAESSRVAITDSIIDARDSAREAIAVDASDHNTIRRNRILGGSIKLYRNCGESAVTRHTTPSDNRIEHNDFAGVLVHVHLSSRDGQRGFCGLDDGLAPWGSAISNLDWARRNRVHANSGGIAYIGRSASNNSGNDLP